VADRLAAEQREKESIPARIVELRQRAKDLRAAPASAELPFN
jgi:hypothetical protein